MKSRILSHYPMVVVTMMCRSMTLPTTGFTLERITNFDARVRSNNRGYAYCGNVLISSTGKNGSESEQVAEEGLSNEVTPMATTTEEQRTMSERVDAVDAVFKGKSQRKNENGSKVQNTDGDSSVMEKIDAFLDKPFFDPDEYDDDDNSFFGKFARLVKTDYELFEAVFVACFFLLLITIAKDVLRAEMYNTVPNGRLF